jgi:hypothetical protein
MQGLKLSKGKLSRRQIRRLFAGPVPAAPVLLQLDPLAGENLPLIRAMTRNGWPVSLQVSSPSEAAPLVAAGVPCHLVASHSEAIPATLSDPLWLVRPAGLLLALIPDP